MAGDSIFVNVEQVESVASNINSINNDLDNELQACKRAFDSLSGVWTGPSAESSRTNFDEFITKYSEQYKEALDRYIEFLRKQVAEGYSDTEQTNENLAEAFK